MFDLPRSKPTSRASLFGSAALVRASAVDHDYAPARDDEEEETFDLPRSTRVSKISLFPSVASSSEAVVDSSQAPAGSGSYLASSASPAVAIDEPKTVLAREFSV